MISTKYATKILAISLVGFMTACVQYESGAVSGAQSGRGPTGPSSNTISFSEHVRLRITPDEGARGMRRDVYNDLKKECEMIEGILERNCRVSRLEIQPIDDPDGREPSVASVQVTLELYGEKKSKSSQ